MHTHMESSILLDWLAFQNHKELYIFVSLISETDEHNSQQSSMTSQPWFQAYKMCGITKCLVYTGVQYISQSEK